MSLLRNAIQTRKDREKKGKSSASLSEAPSEQQPEQQPGPLTFSGPVLDADDILGDDNSDDLYSAGESVAESYGKEFDPPVETESAADLVAPPDSISSDPHNITKADLPDTGLEYAIEGVTEESSAGHSVAAVARSGSLAATPEQMAEELSAKEQVAREHLEQELSAEAQPGKSDVALISGGDETGRQLPPVAELDDSSETQAATDANHRSVAGSVLSRSEHSRSGYSRSGLALSAMNLDPLFFIIIAFACAGLFGSLYALVTQNDAFVSAEFAELRAQQASLDNIANQQSPGETISTERDDNDVGLDQRTVSDATPSGRSSTSNSVINALLVGVAEPATVVQEATRDNSDTVATQTDTAKKNGAASAASATNVPTKTVSVTGITDAADSTKVATRANNGTAVPAVQSNDNSQQEIASLQQQLDELKQSLATQHSKISVLLSNKTETRAAENQSSPESSVSSSKTQPTAATDTNNATSTTTVALDKAGDVIVVENQSGDNAEVVASGSANLATGQLSNTDPVNGVGTSGLAATSGKEIRIQSNDPIASQTGSPQVDFAQVGFPQVLGKAFHAYSIGDFNLAGALYGRALQLDPYNRDANLGVAAVAVKGGNYAVAVQRYRHLLSLHSDDALAFSSLLGLAVITRDTALENELVVHASQYRHVPALHAALGNHYSQTARWTEASRSYASAVGLAPETADYLYNLAVSLDNLGDTDAAVETYQRALSLSEVGNHTFSKVDATERLLILQQSR